MNLLYHLGSKDIEVGMNRKQLIVAWVNRESGWLGLI